MKHNITISQFPKTGKLEYTYTPLQNFINKSGNITEFSTNKLNYNLDNYVEIDTQSSYDDSVNLILNNNSEPPRIINTQFRVQENGSYEYITRNQGIATNMYSEDNIKSETDLFLRTLQWPIIDLESVNDDGNLWGGNYVFYITYADEDKNESEIVSESGTVSIFNGSSPSSITGTLADERTSKNIVLKIKNFDQKFNKFYIYFSRETSDLNGIVLTKYYKITKPYNIQNEVTITIDGYETISEINSDFLTIKYNYFTAAKTQAIVQNMLFLGNVKSSEQYSELLQQLSYRIGVTVKQKNDSIGYVKNDYSTGIFYPNSEYYDPKNIYYYLGYWPDEYYQLAICYILEDGTTTKAFPLYGGTLKLNEEHILNNDSKLEINKIIDENDLTNSGGVFKLPDVKIIDHENQKVCPLYFEFRLPDNFKHKASELSVKGFFFVRSKRTPITLFQGLSVGIDSESGIPMPYLKSGIKTGYVAESFLDELKEDDSHSTLSNDINKHLRSVDNVETSALLSLDPIVVPQIKSMLNWTSLKLKKEYDVSLEGDDKSRIYKITTYNKDVEDDEEKNSFLVFIDKDIPSFYLYEKYFSTRSGTPYSVKDFAFLEEVSEESKYDKLIRGIFCPIIGSSETLGASSIYSIKLDRSPNTFVSSLLNSSNDYFSITNRISIDENINIISAYRGDCFTTTVTIRLNRNFTDSTLPLNNTIVDKNTWENYKGYSNMTSDEKDVENSWADVNLGDVNAVQLGQWITFKCLSNYNLGLRSLDKINGEMVKYTGNPSSFFPVSGINIKSDGKSAESELLNEGYSITLPRKYYTKWTPIPYENYNFENRIAFSNVASTKMFTNGFKIFQGLAYQDVDTSFGSIVKLLQYGQNLLCIFEHGIAIIPVNEKALLSTQEGLSIHLYGAGVLQEQVSIISPDYGSTWMESIIKTPNAYYGVDTHSRKIWKLNNTKGFQCISDFKIQSFLNENIHLSIDDYFLLGVTNVRTHYNNFNGDVIFTFYNNETSWSLCYNELQEQWICRNTWMPLISSNIGNLFYSFDKDAIKTYTKLYQQTTINSGIICRNPFYDGNAIKLDFVDDIIDNVEMTLESISIGLDNIYSVKCFLIYEDDKVIGIYLPEGLKGFSTNPFGIIDNKKTINVYQYNISNIPVYCSIYIDVDEDENASLYYSYIHNNYLYIEDGLFEYDTISFTVAAYKDSNYVTKRFIIIGRSKLKNFNLQIYCHDINSNVCQWYDSQHPFEYEFIVNQPAGLHKIFNNLMIISNNVEPESLEVEIVGDSYDFKDEFIKQIDENIKYKFPIISLPENKIYQTKLTLDKITNEHRLIMHQDCLNIKDFGRRLGNISYIEGKWYIVLQPIYYEDKTLKTTRLRDKWAKIRIKYSGEKLAIITAIQTLMNISYV